MSQIWRVTVMMGACRDGISGGVRCMGLRNENEIGFVDRLMSIP
jgi:hypothetical protein